MKRKLAVFLVTALVAGSLAGCVTTGSTTTAPEKTETEAAAEETETQETEQQASEETSGGAAVTPAGTASDGYAYPKVVTDRPLKVGYIHQNPSEEYATRIIHQTQIEGAHRGWELVDTAIVRDGESTRNALSNLIRQEVDAIIIGNMNMQPLEDLIIQARDAGIGVYCLDTQMVSGCISNSTMPNGQAAMELFYTVGNEMLWKGNVCVITCRALQAHLERTDSVSSLMGVGKAFSEMTILDEQVIDLSNPNYYQQCYDFASTWLQKYGEDIDLIWGSYDGVAEAAYEAFKASGMDMEDTICVGIDGGSLTWSYIRNGTNFKYSYAQAAELYSHNLCELVDQIQVQGIQPGDEGSLVKYYGDTLYSQGVVVGPNNVPEIGSSIHSVFGFYGGDPDDPDAWYNWTDEGGAFLVTDGSE